MAEKNRDKKNPGEDEWTPEQDELVRRALFSLREDLHDLPLAPVEQIKGRGRQRKRTNWYAAGAGLAAAALVVAGVGFSRVLDRPHNSNPASRSSTSSPSVTSGSTKGTSKTGSDELATPSPLPLASEWTRILGFGAAATLSRNAKLEPPQCLATEQVAPTQTEAVSEAEASAPFASQRQYVYQDVKSAEVGSSAMRNAITACTTPGEEVSLVADTASPIWSFKSGGMSGSLALVRVGQDLVYLETWTDGKQPTVTTEQMTQLTALTERRLAKWGSGAATTSPTGSGASGSNTTGTAASRSIAGPDGQTVAADLFIDPASVASPALTATAATESGSGEFEGSATVALACDPDTRTDGTFGIMGVRNASTRSFFVKERVRSFVPTETEVAPLVEAYVAELTSALATCRDNTNGYTTIGAKGPNPKTFKLTSTWNSGKDSMSQFIGVTELGTAGHVATITLDVSELTHPNGLSDEVAYAELDRLLGLARDR